jgi:hypothetical protein
MWHDVALPPETVALRKEVRRAAEERVAPYARESVKPTVAAENHARWKFKDDGVARLARVRGLGRADIDQFNQPRQVQLVRDINGLRQTIPASTSLGSTSHPRVTSHA